jgi:sugar lactone lactonase YvrE/enterochelin esterase-like enzyme
MRHPLLIAILLAFAGLLQAQQQDAALPPDSLPQPGVPKGQVLGPFEWRSQIYPGTVREYHLYVPAQYDASKPTPVFVVNDGLRLAENSLHVPTVLDNLIHQGKVPVQIGIFVPPGTVPAVKEGAWVRSNRSFEYDGLGDRYARFLLEEILPEVAKSYKLSNDPNDRAIAGTSSGAIAAFNVAWERPDAFRRVISGIGTFVSLRGGDALLNLVRKAEPKPIRVFLQDGSNDQDIYGGNWWLANLTMLSSLKWAGYDVHHVWGEGGHNSRDLGAAMPEALTWLWRDYPEPIKRPVTPSRRVDVVVPGDDWQMVSEGHVFTEGPAVNAAGEVYFTDLRSSKIFKVGLDGKTSLFADNTGNVNGLMFGPDGLLYGCAGGAKQIVRYNTSTGAKEVLVNGVESNDIVVLSGGDFYFTDPNNKKVWYVDKAGKSRTVDEGISRPNGIVVSPDQTFLYVSDTDGRFVYSFQIQPDGSLAHKQEFTHLHLSDGYLRSRADGMAVDSTGLLYVTTEMGVQIADPDGGRVHLILEAPERKQISNVVFGGPNRDTLYVTASDKVFKRKVKTKGIDSWKPPIFERMPRL